MPKMPDFSSILSRLSDIDTEGMSDALFRARGRVESSLRSVTRRHSSHNEALENYENQVRRDVYYNQQTGRAEIREPQTMFTRNIACAAASVLFYTVLWALMSALEFLFYSAFHGAGEGFHIDIMNATFTTGQGYFYWDFFRHWTPLKFWFCVGMTAIFATVLWWILYRNLKVQNNDVEVEDINQYVGDQHIQTPEEMMRRFDYFPDVGAHSSVVVSSMISHVALQNKGLNPVEVVIPGDEDMREIEFLAAIAGDREELTIGEAPMIDRTFQRELLAASNVPAEDIIAYDATRIPYNPGNKNRDKLKGYDTVADLINGDWELPLYEPQRPSGAYLVDTAPVNTMVLAITRAGKGQTVIEPTIDMWLREKYPNNMVINDPKGELLVKNYVPATVRGFQPIQFNLINALKTDIYNPLAMAAQAAREGDSTKCAQYIENIAEVFFPLDGGEDPVWPNAANNAFKRAAYGLIDFYLEEERELRRHAAAKRWPADRVDTEVDQLWGHVTLYNAYQLFVQLTARKKKNPVAEFNNEYKASCDENGQLKANTRLGAMSAEEFNAEKSRVEAMGELWGGQAEADLLTLYFAATDVLPRNSMRTLVANANNALKAMGGAEKMMASVYGIAITAMSFFADPTIYTLTSGTPSQNVDLAGLSFPRRIGVRLHPDFMARYHLIGLQCRWQAYADAKLEESLGKDFYHEDIVGREGWCRCYFKGIYEGMTMYWSCEIVNPQTGIVVKTLYFRFDKAYQKSLDGRTYVTDPILDEKIIKNGILVECLKDKTGTLRVGKLRFLNDRLVFDGSEPKLDRRAEMPVVTSDFVRYSEKPKAVFLVTPPHLMKYAKLILILIKQLTDLNFEQSYMTKSNQKPLYKTRFMLDELGNLQSEGHGISGFETMLSIGLGQEQQFTLILQTLQQLRSVYGDDVDKIVQGNAQPLMSKIATPTGWKTMGEMSIGTEVLTPEGKKTQVVGVYPKGVRKVYRVTRKDGSSCLVCNEHLWKVQVK